MFELTVAGWTVDFDDLSELRSYCDWLEVNGFTFEIAVKTL